MFFDVVFSMKDMVKRDRIFQEITFFKVRRKKAEKLVLTPVRRSKRNQKGATNEEVKVGDTVEVRDFVSKTGETVNDNIVILID